MNLPNYFLADLPPGASLNAGMLTEACRSLKRNRELYLVERSTHSLLRVLAELGERWREPGYEFRRMALAADPALTGFPVATLAAGIDGFFRHLTEENLQAWITQDLGHPMRLDRPVAAAGESAEGRSGFARGPDLLMHIAAGNVPCATWVSLVAGLLVRSAQWVKCARGTSLLARLFAHSLYQAEPKLASCIEIAEWPGSASELNEAVYSEASCVTATGSDDTLGAVRSRLPAQVRFLGYGHRLSFGYVAREALYGSNVRRLAAAAAADVIAWNQLGCLSPHVLYVEDSGAVSAEAFADLLAEALAEAEAQAPRGPLPAEISAGITARRHIHEVRAAHNPGTRLWQSPGSTAWTVVFENDALFHVSCLHRFIYVKAVDHLRAALEGADAVRGSVSTVGLAGAGERLGAIVTELARWGVTRVCPLGRMQLPPLGWRHDGRPVLGDLVTWTDWEGGY
jgi:hypothetical protein